MRRNELGRIIGKSYGSDFLHDEDEHWKDKKIKACDVRFPSHSYNKPSEVRTYYIK